MLWRIGRRSGAALRRGLRARPTPDPNYLLTFLNWRKTDICFCVDTHAYFEVMKIESSQTLFGIVNKKHRSDRAFELVDKQRSR